MNSNNFLSPDYLTPEELDRYLNLGYYRMQQSVFTTDFIVIDDLLCPVFWLRTDINRLNHATLIKNIRKYQKKFSVSIKDAFINEEAESLYLKYKTSIDFDTYESISYCLNGESEKNIFSTKIISIRDGNTLIAAGYFDIGKDSLMGILNFFDPEYRKFSLGKLLMLLKLNYAVQHKMKFYYTGYFSTRYTKFDYKIFPDKNAMDVYVSPQQKWVSYVSINHEELEKTLFALYKIQNAD